AMAKHAAWVPQARVDELQLWQADRLLLTASNLQLLEDWSVSAEAILADWPEPLRIAAELAPAAPWQLRVAAEDRGLKLGAVWESTGDEAQLTVELTQPAGSAEDGARERISGDARFVRGQVPPQSARLVSEKFSIDPGAWGARDNYGLDGLQITSLD